MLATCKPKEPHLSSYLIFSHLGANQSQYYKVIVSTIKELLARTKNGSWNYE